MATVNNPIVKILQILQNKTNILHSGRKSELKFFLMNPVSKVSTKFKQKDDVKARA